MPPSGSQPPGSAGNSGEPGSESEDAGEFPEGEFPGETGGNPGEGEVASAGAEPGFEDSAAAGSEGDGQDATGSAGDGGLPDMRDEEPSLEDSMGAFEDAMGEASGQSQGSQTAQGQTPGGQSPGGQPPGGEQGSGQPGGNPYGIPGAPGSSQSGQGSGTLTPGEQVAILDAQLERGTGEFDAMILEEQAAQRRAAREQAANRPPPGSTETQSSGSGGFPEGEGEGDMADGGVYSEGGGMPGSPTPGGGGASRIPQETAKYPPPTDIPSGNDDDVVARQLREAAMRESDPAVREKLWDEYRKYKGVSS